MATAKRRRCPIAESEKKALQNYYSVTCLGKAPYEKCKQWFDEQYGHQHSPSSISTILKNSKYARLDEETGGPDVKRRTPAAWPGLEIALFAWQKQMERKTLAITGDVLRA
jgi:hypothetical protein